VGAGQRDQLGGTHRVIRHGRLDGEPHSLDVLPEFFRRHPVTPLCRAVQHLTATSPLDAVVVTGPVTTDELVDQPARFTFVMIDQYFVQARGAVDPSWAVTMPSLTGPGDPSLAALAFYSGDHPVVSWRIGATRRQDAACHRRSRCSDCRRRRGV
jgi:hypothetical protein